MPPDGVAWRPTPDVGRCWLGRYHGGMAKAKYKAIFMDFYGTVAAGDAEAVERICARAVEELGLPVTAHELAVAWGERFFETLDACLEGGFQTMYACECQSMSIACAQWCPGLDPVPYVDELHAYMCAPVLHPEAMEVLEGLGVPICCVSNADADHLHAAIAHHRLPFAEVVCSEDVRSYKPERAIFERALQVMSAEAGEVLHVGDSLHSDVMGARAVGIESVWVCRGRRIHDVGTAQADHNISNLKDLRSIV